ncbi:hemolysin [Brevundimonas sp. R86498]|uniref:hemolysin n=1 Tax=Brevundimonas sp. R86498 TaxID=3093845 RepID=UPI0037C881E1
MRLIVLVAATAALTAGCAPTAAPGPDGVGGPARCDAEASKSLIGRNRAAVSFVQGADVRFVCTTCAATEDYRPNRLNIRYDEATGIIRSVDCG